MPFAEVSASLNPGDDAPRIRGFLESIGRGAVSGWVVDIDHPGQPISVEILARGRPVGRTQTTFGRPDIDSVLGAETCSRFYWPHLRGDLLPNTADQADPPITILVRRPWEDPDRRMILPIGPRAWSGLLAESEAARLQPGVIKLRNVLQAASLTHPGLSRFVEDARLRDDLFRLPGHVLAFSDYAFNAYSFYLHSGGLDDPRSALRHYLAMPAQSDRGAPLFDVKRYVQEHPDLAALKGDPLLHYLESGVHEGRRIRLIKDGRETPSTPFSQLLRMALGADRVGTQERALLLSWFDQRRAAAFASVTNKGWRGQEPIPESERFYGSLAADKADVGPAYAAGSQAILDRYYASTPVEQQELTVSELVIQLRSRSAAENERPRDIRGLLEGGVSLITPYFRHRRHFIECAASVALLFEITSHLTPVEMEWILVNDDPSITEAELLELIPEPLRERTFIHHAGGLGTTGATNLGIGAAKFDWLLFLDCDDVILPDAIVVMDHYARARTSRYLSSAIIDIDEVGRVIRYRPHLRPPGRAPAAGMIAGHLKAIHRSAFQDASSLDPMFDSCQDYDFLLRLMQSEDVVLIPEYLYMYRWHQRSQSVSKVFNQERLALEVKKAFIEGRRPTAADCLTPAERGRRTRVAAVIRSTGERTASLLDAVASCRTLSDDVEIRPVITVHGDAERAEFVSSFLRRHGHGPDTVDVIRADGADRLRGHPLNRGAAHALKEAGCDAFGVLDDDDIYLPGLEQMARLAARPEPLILAGRTLCRDLEGEVTEMYPLLPSSTLLKQNILPTNAFLCNAAAAAAIEARFPDLFPEDMHYLEDWVFCLRALATGVPFHFFDGFVGEFRLGSDGNTGKRRRPFEFEKCAVKAQTFGRTLAGTVGLEFERHVTNLPQRFARRMTSDEVETALAWTPSVWA